MWTVDDEKRNQEGAQANQCRCPQADGSAMQTAVDVQQAADQQGRQQAQQHLQNVVGQDRHA